MDLSGKGWGKVRKELWVGNQNQNGCVKKIYIIDYKTVVIYNIPLKWESEI